MKSVQNDVFGKSKSFGRGLFRGLAPQNFLFSPMVIRRDPRFDGSVENAWLTVGRVLRDAFDVEGGNQIEKTNAKKTAGNNRH
jgi:hypothetical protein